MRTELGTPLPKNKNDKHPENTYLYVVQEVFLDYLLGNAFSTYSWEKMLKLDTAHNSNGQTWQSPWRLNEDKESHDNGRARLCFLYYLQARFQEPIYQNGFKAHSWYYPQFLPLYLYLAKGNPMLMWYHKWDCKRACKKMLKVRYQNDQRVEFKHTDGDLIAFTLGLAGVYDSRCKDIYNDCTMIIYKKWGGWHKVFEEYFGRDLERRNHDLLL